MESIRRSIKPGTPIVNLLNDPHHLLQIIDTTQNLNRIKSKKPKTAGMSFSDTLSLPYLPRPMPDIQFGSMPNPMQRTDPVPDFADIDVDFNPQQPRRGTLSPLPHSNPVSSFNALTPGEHLVDHRIRLLNAHQDRLFTNVIMQLFDHDSGELLGIDVTPPAHKKDPKPVPSREQQRYNVGMREWQRSSRHQINLSEAGVQTRHSMITRTDRRLAAHNARIDEAVAAARARAEQDAALTRLQRLQEQRTGLADDAALLNSPTLRGLGLQLNPDFAAAIAEEDYDAEYDADDEKMTGLEKKTITVGLNVDNEYLTGLEQMERLTINLDSVPPVTLPPRTFASIIKRSRARARRSLTISGQPKLVTPILPTTTLTPASFRTSYRSFPEQPIRRAREFLTRASKGSKKKRSRAE